MTGEIEVIDGAIPPELVQTLDQIVRMPIRCAGRMSVSSRFATSTVLAAATPPFAIAQRKILGSGFSAPTSSGRLRAMCGSRWTAATCTSAGAVLVSTRSIRITA